MILTPVILCGGSGTRLWPLSRKSFPKQFVPLVGHKSLLHLTLERLVPLGARVVAVAAEDAKDVGTIATSERWTSTAPDPGQRVWTDDYSNIAGAFWRMLRPRWARHASTGG